MATASAAQTMAARSALWVHASTARTYHVPRPSKRAELQPECATRHGRLANWTVHGASATFVPSELASPPMIARALCLLSIALVPAAVRAQEAGVLFGDDQLAPHFASGPLQKAVLELQAGHGAAALRLIPAVPRDPQTKWL